MSLEAWGDEGDVVPEGYVTEELYEEALADTKRLLDAVQKYLVTTAEVAPSLDEALTKAELLKSMASLREELGE